MDNKISAFMVVKDEEQLIERSLKSIKGVVDEILVIHDGKCKDNTLKISRKYTRKVYERPFKGRSSLHMLFALENCKHDWLLKLDADEYLSGDLRENIKRLTKNTQAHGYTFLWRWWDGKKYITKNFPHKLALFRKSRVSYIELPGQDEPKVNGNVIQKEFALEHRPLYNNFNWSNSFKRGHKRAKDQARWILKDFDSLKKYQYDSDDFSLSVRLRRDFPFSSMIAFPPIASAKILINKGAWKEGLPVLNFALQEFIYQIVFSYLVMKNKRSLEDIR